MKKTGTVLLTTFLALVWSVSLMAQEAKNDFKQQFMNHFNYANRVFQLAKEIPSEKYSWRPDEGVMSIEEVFVHIAQYNYNYLVNTLGIDAPDGVDLQNLNDVQGKENVIKLMEASIEFVTSKITEMPASALSDSYELYGRTVSGQAVLMQLITHLSEHTGQSIAYARMNGITPPWNQ